MKIENLEKANFLVGRIKILNILQQQMQSKVGLQYKFKIEAINYQTVSSPFINLIEYNAELNDSDIDFIVLSIQKRIEEIEKELEAL